jgi:eukaryotic-like serine/threonine-protein kinase
MSRGMRDENSPFEQPTLALAGSPTTENVVAPLLGEYELLGEIGRGGMGVVYKAREPGLNRLVAIKMVLPGALPTEAELQRFSLEAAAAANLQHPHIVAVHRVGQHDNRPFFTMDFIDGPSLAQRTEQGPLPSRVAARYLAAVARAIHHAHEHGILHRDLKPANILLDAADQPHVTDFGLAKHFTTDIGQTRTGAILGTPGYMAPEQASSCKDLGPACDIYGLGAVLYELLTARPPFRGETPLDTLQQVLEVEPAPPRLLNAKVERDLETICLKCLNKQPALRYASALELAEDLERYLRGDSIQARSLNVLDRLARTLERSQHDVEFAAYGSLLYWFAAIVGVVHVVKYYFVVTRQPISWVILSQAIQFTLMGLVFWRYRKHGVLPTNTAERHMWSVWVGYLTASVLVSIICAVLFGQEKLYESILYPFYAVIAGLAFFALGSNYWGGCYAFGVAFFVLPGVMLLHQDWGGLEFGGLWTIALITLGHRLHNLGRERAGRLPA